MILYYCRVLEWCARCSRWSGITAGCWSGVRGAVDDLVLPTGCWSDAWEYGCHFTCWRHRTHIKCLIAMFPNSTVFPVLESLLSMGMLNCTSLSLSMWKLLSCLIGWDPLVYVHISNCGLSILGHVNALWPVCNFSPSNNSHFSSSVPSYNCWWWWWLSMWNDALCWLPMINDYSMNRKMKLCNKRPKY